jgi:hypothetical protein
VPSNFLGFSSQFCLLVRSDRRRYRNAPVINFQLPPLLTSASAPSTDDQAERQSPKANIKKARVNI